jgi:predicted GNAT family acetyltransferase
MPDEIAIEREDGPSFGRWFVRFGDGSEGEMTYRRVNDRVIAINHTACRPSTAAAGMR